MTELCQSIADCIQDYRSGEIGKASAEHVLRWVEQFDVAVREPLLTEMSHVLKKTYISKEKFRNCLLKIASGKNLVGDNAAQFWKNVNFLDVQKKGRSQRDILELFNSILSENFGITIQQCGSQGGSYVYLDDMIFTGSHVIEDISGWLENTAPKEGRVYVVAAVVHKNGACYAKKEVTKKASQVGKRIEFLWKGMVQPENRLLLLSSSDVLSPAQTPDDSAVQAYVQGLQMAGYPPKFRSGGSIGSAKIFSSPEGRDLLEQQFLIAGAKIRQLRPTMTEALRPLGFQRIKALGFGSTFVTYRNCPNTCPLAFWFGDPWHPLLPRRTNAESLGEEFGAEVSE